jgi:hypothetical protein
MRIRLLPGRQRSAVPTFNCGYSLTENVLKPFKQTCGRKKAQQAQTELAILPLGLRFLRFFAAINGGPYMCEYR